MITAALLALAALVAVCLGIAIEAFRVHAVREACLYTAGYPALK